METSGESELIFSIRKRVNDQRTDEILEEEESTNDEEPKILCILWKNGKMGASYFSCVEKSVSSFILFFIRIFNYFHVALCL